MKNLMLLMIGIATFIGCNTVPRSQEDQIALHADVNAAIAAFNRKDPGLQHHFEQAPGYAVFPSVGKGGIGLGAAYGRGEVFEDGRMIGYCDVTQATIGLQLGGQVYREVIFFQTREALDSFVAGEFELAAQASAVAAEAGASETADYENGVLVLTLVGGGLMYEASVGGQKFDFAPAGTGRLVRGQSTSSRSSTSDEKEPEEIN